MKKILVLGERGMLGNAVLRYFSINKDYSIHTMKNRWSSENLKNFKEEIIEISPEFIVNCIGKIPQKGGSDLNYQDLNVNLPMFLETLNIKIIHPSTDCEFSGVDSRDFLYKKSSERDAADLYGISKAKISEKIEKEFKNTKIIRVSILGHEINTSVSLLDWFLSSKGEVDGYVNHYWNGITTLEWAKLCSGIIENWDNYPTLNQYGTKEINSKYDLLNIIKKVYDKNIVINKFITIKNINKSLESDMLLRKIEDQLYELKEFYKN